jgi:trimeric autotransporter adhesin
MTRFGLLLSVLLALVFAGCTQPPYLASIQVLPATPSLTAFGQTLQFQAIGTYERAGNHPTQTEDITSQVSWSSSTVGVATINAAGLATAAGSGNSTITATMTGQVGSEVLSVTATTQAVHDLVSVAVIPTAQTTLTIGEPAQFIAIGTYNALPITLDITNQVTWQSSDVKIATINSAGLAISNAMGTATMTAIATAADGSTITGSSTLTVAPAGGSIQIPQLSVYEVGLGSGTVTSNVPGISCVAGASSAAGCTGNFTLGTPVTLTETPASGSTFGGWSADCAVLNATQCTITMNTNEPVGAIFNH